MTPIRATYGTRVHGREVFPEPFRVVEGVMGYWHYHLAKPGEFKSLCGRRVMSTGLTLKHWGKKNPDPWLPAKWCTECAFGKEVAK